MVAVGGLLADRRAVGPDLAARASPPAGRPGPGPC